MAFTVAEVENVFNAALDWHLDKGTVYKQSIQEKPLLKALMAKKKTFASGKGEITVRVKGDYTTTIMGFSHEDEVAYANPANIKTASYPWKELHWGITVSFTELKIDGNSVTDTNGANVSQHSGREVTALANLFDDKIEDMLEGGNRGMNLMFWKDGTQDAKEVPGIRSFILNDPTTAVTVGGLDQGANTWWRNRASLGVVANTGNAASTVLIIKMSQERRQLRRYGGRPTQALCGSDFLDQLEREVRANGSFTNTGWAKGGKIDVSAADQTMKDIDFEYDPTLDDLSLSKFAFVLDWKSIYPLVMEGEDMKKHTPSRPENKYVMYRALTWTGGLGCRQRNANGVYSIA